jgi:hypothetical protein
MASLLINNNHLRVKRKKQITSVGPGSDQVVCFTGRKTPGGCNSVSSESFEPHFYLKKEKNRKRERERACEIFWNLARMEVFHNFSKNSLQTAGLDW